MNTPYGNWQPPSAPPPGAGMPAGYSPAPRTNGLAVTSMVVSLVGILSSWLGIGGLLAVLGVIFGHVSLRQISQRGDAGRGMAIAGLVLGYVVVAGFLLLILLVLMGVASISFLSTTQ